MADDSGWYPGKNLVGWVKEKSADHPRLAGAVAVAAPVAILLGGPVAWGVAGTVIVATAAGAGASLGNAMAQDAKDKADKEEKK